MSPYVVVTVDHQPGGPTRYGLALTTNGIDRVVVEKPSMTVKEAHRRARELERRLARENN